MKGIKVLTLKEFINQQELIVKELLQAIMEKEKHVQYCCYCVERRGEKMSCCSENHWIEFNDLDDDTQLEIVKEILQDE
jgi:sulfur relay (sulfurtransferase) complex TusBCD TusD component (DsrE family)